VSRLLTNPLFWVFAFIVVWIVGITLSIANDPEGARSDDNPGIQSSSRHGTPAPDRLTSWSVATGR
jgi:hypothetical protein